ncbi:MAG: hypothetical protein D6705_17660 [Deltaproteobacteria bacterium]|nr:MAG: hypothetical protein D6705_17660 [Deltaproteobacteria bacterium]
MGDGPRPRVRGRRIPGRGTALPRRLGPRARLDRRGDGARSAPAQGGDGRPPRCGHAVALAGPRRCYDRRRPPLVGGVVDHHGLPGPVTSPKGHRGRPAPHPSGGT